jgi:hypothetical protein
MSPTHATILFWLAALCCAIAQLALLRSALVAWRGPRAPSPSGSARAGRAVELLWALLPAAGLALVLVLTWRAIHAAT